MSDEDVFAQAIGVVKPLAKEGKVQAKITKNKHDILRNIEEKEQTQQQVMHHQHIAAKRTDTWELKASGVSAQDVKKLAQTCLSHELDLHGKTQAEATQALQAFFNSALADGIRRISVIHGRGKHSKGKSVLRDITYQWLEHGAFAHFILAATPAKKSLGGACHILLRKTNSE